MSIPLIIRELGLQPYEPIWHKMRDYTDQRTASSADEIWLLEHPPVFTQGQAGKPEHLLNPGDIPVVQVDRGGQVTYHGPGQLVAYLLIDIERRKWAVRSFVCAVERALIQTLAELGITAVARRDAPGVYVDGAKIASLGLRIRHGRSYHGLAFNVDMDLEPFSRINPCGFAHMKMTQLSALNSLKNLAEVSPILVKYLTKQITEHFVSGEPHD
jgi:lipoyl(octanoyl) transferase